MSVIERLPALPLIACDPYFSIWMPADTLTGAKTAHWAGAEKPITGTLNVDGKNFRFLGTGGNPSMQTVAQRVTPTGTFATLAEAGVELDVSFRNAALPDDLDWVSTPITFVDFTVRSADGQTHKVSVNLHFSYALCYDGSICPPMKDDSYCADGLNVYYTGQQQQRPLSNSGDHVTIDWGYLYLASRGEVCRGWEGVDFNLRGEAGEAPVKGNVYVAYDEIISADYFGAPCRAWFQRNGKTLVEALMDADRQHDSLMSRMDALDKKVMDEAEAIGGEDYRLLTCAAWRHTFAAHKLIAIPGGEMAFLSKENDSNGCMGTVDVSYPSTPLFLKYCPELVNALCRPVLQFANMPVWTFDFAPHDVGRYPYCTGQVYAARYQAPNGATNLPFYTYPAGADVYEIRWQMPVEECGNMLVMLESAIEFGADSRLAAAYRPTLDKWVNYLLTYGEDPGEQLCTDDFAGHLARNINLSAKALAGIMCYSRLVRRMGDTAAADRTEQQARAMAERWLSRAEGPEGTYLTFDGKGWSMKYNLAWDNVLGLGLFDKDFYTRETHSYLRRLNKYGLPLDSRADYTKSDWEIWTASLAQDKETFDTIVHTVAEYLRNTPSRVAFSDWYNTKTGEYVSFIARSVQGGMFMPMLLKK